MPLAWSGRVGNNSNGLGGKEGELIRSRVYGTNWKLRESRKEHAREYARRLEEFARSQPGLSLFVLPPFTLIDTMATELADSTVLVGGQNCYWRDDYDVTGEVSPRMLVDVGAKIVLVGHPERTLNFGESDRTVNRKLLLALSHGLTVVVCVGEVRVNSVVDRDAVRSALRRQLLSRLNGAGPKDLSQIILAYEPIWAIGESGQAASPDMVSEKVSWLRTSLSERYGHLAQTVPILYGGNVNQQNCEGFGAGAGVNGLFVGRAALDVRSFIEIVRMTSATQLAAHQEG